MESIFQITEPRMQRYYYRPPLDNIGIVETGFLKGVLTSQAWIQDIQQPVKGNGYTEPKNVVSAALGSCAEDFNHAGPRNVSGQTDSVSE